MLRHGRHDSAILFINFFRSLAVSDQDKFYENANDNFLRIISVSVFVKTMNQDLSIREVLMKSANDNDNAIYRAIVYLL